MMRDTRILGMMMLFGISAAVLAGQWKYAGAVTIAAIAVGGFMGELWDRWRRKDPISFDEFREIREDGFRDGLEAAAKLIDDCAAISDDKEQAARHALLIRRLKPSARTPHLMDQI